MNARRTALVAVALAAVLLAPTAAALSDAGSPHGGEAVTGTGTVGSSGSGDSLLRQSENADPIVVRRAGDHLSVSVAQSVYPDGTGAGDAEIIVTVERLNGSTTIQGATASGDRYLFTVPISAIAAENVSLDRASVTVFATDRSKTVERDLRLFVFGDGQPARQNGTLRVPVAHAWGFAEGGLEVLSRQNGDENDYRASLRFRDGGGVLVLGSVSDPFEGGGVPPVESATVRLTAPAYDSPLVQGNYTFERRLTLADAPAETTADGRFAVPVSRSTGLTAGDVPVRVRQGDRSRTVTGTLRFGTDGAAVVLDPTAVRGMEPDRGVTLQPYPGAPNVSTSTTFTPTAAAATTVRVVDGRLAVEHPLVYPERRYALVVSAGGASYRNVTVARPGRRGGRLPVPATVVGNGTLSVTILRNGTTLVSGATPGLTTPDRTRRRLDNGTLVFEFGDGSEPDSVRAWTVRDGRVVALDAPFDVDYGADRWWINVSKGSVPLVADEPRTLLLRVDDRLRAVTVVPERDWPARSGSGGGGTAQIWVPPVASGLPLAVLVGIFFLGTGVGAGIGFVVGPSRVLTGLAASAVVATPVAFGGAKALGVGGAFVPSLPLSLAAFAVPLGAAVGGAVELWLGARSLDDLYVSNTAGRTGGRRARTGQPPPEGRDDATGSSGSDAAGSGGSGTAAPTGNGAGEPEPLRIAVTDEESGDPATVPVPVTVRRASDGETVAEETTDDGSCVVHVPPDRYTVVAATDDERASTRVNTEILDSTELSLPVAPTEQKVSVTVVDDETGDPVPDASIELSVDGRTATVETDVDGHVEFTVPASVERLDAAVSKDGYRTTERTLDLDASGLGIALEPRSPGRIAVSVTAGGDPATDVPVSVRADDGSAVDDGRTGNDGTVAFEGLEPGRYAVAAEGTDGSDTDAVRVRPGETHRVELDVPVDGAGEWREAVPDLGETSTPPGLDGVELAYDDFEKRDLLGQGGNADVYRAVATGVEGRPTVALKEPRIQGTLQTETVERILSEARHWQRVDDHDHVVTVYDWDSGPIPWLAMEYMDGGHLGDRVGEMDLAEGLWTAVCVSRAVWHANRDGIAHLDLKPANVLFRETPGDAWDVPKVGDWGLSKRLLDHSQSLEGLTPQYAAPEQFDEDEYGEPDAVTDVYQLGAVFYALFAGRPPFEGSASTVMHDVLHESPAPPSEHADVPDELDDVLLRALETEKDDRYESVVYLRDDLQDLLESL
ncbi:MAG: protein kinase [Haloarculaceae archaeon]